jgi:hypothetical protein
MRTRVIRHTRWAVSLLLAASLAACIESDGGGGGDGGVPDAPLDQDRRDGWWR